MENFVPLTPRLSTRLSLRLPPRIWLFSALVLLGAHFYRASEYGIALCCAGMLFFTAGTSAWKRYALAFFLLWGAVEWGDAALHLVRARAAFGAPWLRAGLILLSVAAYTALAGLYALRSAQAAQSAKLATPAGPDQKATEERHALLKAAVFIGTFVSLYYLRRNAPLDFLLFERYLPVFGAVQLFFAACYAAFATEKLTDPAVARKTRRLLWLFFGCVFFGQFFLGLYGLGGMLLTGKLHAPLPAFILFAPLFRDSLSVMLFISLVAALLTGSAWCSLLCYFGPFDALAAGTKAARPLPDRFAPLLKYGRPAVLVLGALAAFALGRAGLGRTQAVLLCLAFAVCGILIMMSASSGRRRMLHCTAFCPMGLAVNLLGRLAPWRMRVNSSTCNHCGACETACKYSAITRESRERGKTLLRCSLCRDCMAVCPKRSITLRCPGLSPTAAHTLFVGLLAWLHALFLNIAMV